MAFDITTLDLDQLSRNERRKRGNRLIVLFMASLSLVWLLPFYYVAVSILKSPEEYAQGGALALPQGFAPLLDNLVGAWTVAKMGQGMFNSLLYGLVGAGLAVLIAAMAAHGLSRFEFRGRAYWFLLIFSGTVFPFQMYLIPLFFTYMHTGLLNTRLGMILFYTAICIPFPVLVLKNYLSQLSREMDEAARIDGCGELRLFLQIVLPNCYGPLVAVFLLQFTWIWNDLLFSTVLTQSPEVRSIMSALQVFQGAYARGAQTLVMTASVIASLPTLVLFFVLKKRFMQGMQVS